VFGSQGSGIPPKAPVLVSNDDLLSVFSAMKQHMSEQQKTNLMMLREIEGLKSGSKKPEQNMFTLLLPKTLDFNSEGYSGAHDGDIIPMQSARAGHTPATTVTTTRASGFSSGFSSRFPSGSSSGFSSGFPSENLFKNSYSDRNAYISNNIISSQDTGISPVMAKELQKLKDMISSIPAVIKPIPEVSSTCHKISRFAPPIFVMLESPKDFRP
jgi:hypothetical protein